MIQFLNPNTSAQTTSTMLEIARQVRPDLELAGVTAPFGGAMITDAAALETGARAVAEMARGLPPKATGVVVAAFGDPGLDEIRASLAIPVTGIGEASILEAGTGGRAFAIATVTPLLDRAIRARVAASPVAAQFTGCLYTPGDPLRLSADPVALRDALRGAVAAAISAGAEAVIIGGGPLAVAARALAPEFSVPIIEPIPAAMRRICGKLGL